MRIFTTPPRRNRRRPLPLVLSACVLLSPVQAQTTAGEGADPAAAPMQAPPPPTMVDGPRADDGSEASPEGAGPAPSGITVEEGPRGTVITLPGGETLEPEVTIRRQPQRTVTEYRINGRLYMVKVQPTKGPAYYLSDTDGDGELESRQNELDPAFLIPKWILFSW